MKNYDELTLQEANLINSLPDFQGTMEAGDYWLLDWEDENDERFHALEVLIAVRLGHLNVANDALIRAQKLSSDRAKKTFEKMTPKCPGCGGGNFQVHQTCYEKMPITFENGQKVCGKAEFIKVTAIDYYSCSDCDFDLDDFVGWFL